MKKNRFYIKGNLEKSFFVAEFITQFLIRYC